MDKTGPALNALNLWFNGAENYWIKSYGTKDSYRKMLRLKTIGLISHDRILNGRELNKAL